VKQDLKRLPHEGMKAQWQGHSTLSSYDTRARQLAVHTILLECCQRHCICLAAGPLVTPALTALQSSHC
jgi:hypothetical protein